MQKSSISQMLHCFPFPNTLLEPSVGVLSKIWRITSSLGERANTQSTQDPLVLGFLASLQEHFFFLDPRWQQVLDNQWSSFLNSEVLKIDRI